MQYKPKCCLIGSGNVASQFAPVFSQYLDITTVYSRKLQNAKTLCQKLSDDVRAIDRLEELPVDADFYLISVSDNAISEILSSTKHVTSGIWAHTSGSVPMDVFKGEKNEYGVFYPLQTFSKNKKVDFAEIPFLIEGNNEKVSDFLMKLASKVSDKIYLVDSDGRKKVHIAAVFACNFTNYLWNEADMILKESSLDLSLLKPLLKETLDKINVMSPLDAQTGPARRGDTETINEHLSLLDAERAYIYKMLSDGIRKNYDK